MQEQMNKAMASLNETVGDDVPTFDEVRDKIEARYAKAKACRRADHVSRSSARMLEIEQATRQRRGAGAPVRDARPARPGCRSDAPGAEAGGHAGAGHRRGQERVTSGRPSPL